MKAQLPVTITDILPGGALLPDSEVIYGAAARILTSPPTSNRRAGT